MIKRSSDKKDIEVSVVQSKKSNELLIIFTRYPKIGKTKTRLIPFLGAKKAAELQRAMAEYIFGQCLKLHENRSSQIDVYFEGGEQNEVRGWVPGNMGCFQQRGEDLGERMKNALHDNFFRCNVERILLVGADCPHITPEILNQGYDMLQERDLVLGPASDGGYYLIGLKRPASFLFENIEWGTERVLDQTIVQAEREGLTWGTLPTLTDIDKADDLPQLRNFGKPFAEFFMN
ncbi:MAG: TIGR04282 family arsenosugar biosynthesis glycosyltransferase [Desulfobulbaceae bacterium]|nr:TIGR04282 family arsenosugar biosynthesis glycosyltransferase [Desulfobulbaceae bacterium]